VVGDPVDSPRWDNAAENILFNRKSAVLWVNFLAGKRAQFAELEALNPWPPEIPPFSGEEFFLRGLFSSGKLFLTRRERGKILA